MAEVNLLEGYPQPKEPRVVADNLRTIQHRITASRRDIDFFDGDRNCGYGGFSYDGRWVPVAKRIIDKYALQDGSSVLHLNCEKGFLLSDLKNELPTLSVAGTETSSYAIENAMENIKGDIHLADPRSLPFDDDSFDFVIGFGVVYIHTLGEAIEVLREINRVSRGSAFITLATYETEEEYFLFRDWTLLGTLMFKKEDWIEIMNHAGYCGDYAFTGAKSLNLIRGK